MGTEELLELLENKLENNKRGNAAKTDLAKKEDPADQATATSQIACETS